MLKLQRETILCLLFFLLAVIVYSNGLNVHGLEYRDDEIFYFKSTQEMLETKDYLSPTYFGEDRFQKPILFYWFILFSYQIFGLSWFAARFVSVLLAALTIVVTWKMAKALFNEKTANLSSIILMTVSLFFRHAKNVVPDMSLNFFIVLAMYFAIKFIQEPSKSKYSVLFFISCGLGFMVKGFGALLFPVATVILYALLTKQPRLLGQFRFGRGFLVLMIIILPWFLYMVLTHGSAYLQYMLVDETKNRVWDANSERDIWDKIKNFFEHLWFYLYVIFAYFAPWSLFAAGAVPLAFARRKDTSLKFLLIWFCTVLFVFSFLFFRITHYILILTTPFAILVAYFLLTEIQKSPGLNRVKKEVQKYICLIILTVCYAAFGFLLVFLAGGPKIWIWVLMVSYLTLSLLIVKSSKNMTAPVVLGLFLVFVLSQTSLLAKAGVTSHTTLQKFAETIHKDKQGEATIGVGSYDIHEKEFQVYFEEKVVQGGHTHEGAMKYYLTQLFNTDKVVYCLVIDKDLEFLENLSFGKLDVLQEEYMFRRRMDLDGGFVRAIVEMDQEKVRDYLKEKVVLLKRAKKS